ncbi:hypothetical protein PPN31114_00476 [Pandoraea pneumonica]|uniref:Uncharacterized protein n=1 Tax=Pandoraea pneumonica TaxID=2508299 RepID=A0A5E4S014_9BURK|nr:hypothetical protein [Pandoraea pneumonica]VVD68451.1 hypothetical protein PPN31114_00476 [Pandoraea pneumonica]
MDWSQEGIDALSLETLTKAFPESLRSEVGVVSNLMRSYKIGSHGLAVMVGGQSLQIPYRVYYAPDESLFANLNDVQSVMYACMLTRNPDGYVRQRQVQRLAESSAPWVAPFVAQLCGEYVIEILSAVEASIPSMDHAVYGAFFRENPQFFRATRDRMISYWDCYYRSRYQRASDYVGFRLFDQFKNWADSAALGTTTH